MQKKKSLSPIITMIIIIVFVVILSSLLAFINFDGTGTIISNGILETSIVVVKNILSKEGLIYFFSNVITNFSLLEPFVLIILSLMAVGVAKESGFLKHLFNPLKNVKFNVLTFIVIFISVISTIIGDYSYIILLPLIAILYQYNNKSPILGILTVFLGITLGYGTGIFYNYNDYALGVLTQAAAVIDVDPSYRFNLYSNIYIMIVSTIAISFLITFLINKYLSKKITINTKYEDEIVISNKAFIFSIIGLIITIIPIVIMLLPNGILLDNTQSHYVAKVFGNNSPFNISFMYLFLVVLTITSLIYGVISKNFKNNHDFGWSFTKEINNIGYLFVLMFLSSILISIVNWTNLGTVIANNLIYIISLFDFTGIPLIIITFIFIILMSILIPGSLEKWALISPVLVPLFMRGNLTPDFAQFVFKAADSIGKIITPLFVYFIVMLGFVQKYNKNETKVTLFNTIKLIWPIILVMIIFWLLILIIWYVAGLPLGFDTLVTM